MMDKIKAKGAIRNFQALAALLFGAVAGAFFAPFHYVADLFSHFLIQYFIGAALLCGAAFAIGFPRLGLALAALGFLCTVQYGLSLRQGAGQGAFTPTAGLHVLHVNMLVLNPEVERLGTLIRTENADLVNIQEASVPMGNYARDHLTDIYPYQVLQPRMDSYGTIILSRHPIAADTAHTMQGPEFTNTLHEVRLNLPEGTVTFLSLHTRQPLGEDNFAQRNFELAYAATLARDIAAARPDEPLIMAGDLNITPFSPFFRKLIADSALRHAGGDVILPRPTWPQVFKLPILQIPIDHLLYAPANARLDTWARVPSPGSDHIALRGEFALRPATP